MQDLIDRFNSETVPLLCRLHPGLFTHQGPTGYIENRAYFTSTLDYVNPKSLDSLAAIAEACGVHTMAGCYSEEGVVKWIWRYITDSGITLEVCPYDVSFVDELSARLAATIAVVAAVAGGEA